MPPTASPPAPAPAAPAAPAAAPAAASNSPLQSAFADLDQMMASSPAAAPEQAEPPKPAAEPPELDETQQLPPDPMTDFETLSKDTKPDAKAAVEPPKPAAEPPVEKMAPKQLREAYNSAKARLAEMEKTVADLKKSSTENVELKNLQERLAEREKRLEEIQKELEYTAFEKSDQFKETYEKPYHRAWNLGRSWVSSIKVNDPETGEVRPGTPQDFDAVMQLSVQNPDAAAELLESMFGPKAASVGPYMAKVNESLQSMQEALKEAREKGAARDKDFTERTTKQQQEIRSHIEASWKRYQTEAIEKYPHWFKPTDGDDEGNAALQKGFEQAARAFSRLNAADPNLTPEEREATVASHAALFNKAAAFPRLVVQLKQRESRIAALEKELQGFRDSQPGGGMGAAKTGAQGQGSGWEAELEKLARPAQFL